jgi:hypothetical protein
MAVPPPYTEANINIPVCGLLATVTNGPLPAAVIKHEDGDKYGNGKKHENGAKQH